MLLKGNKVIKVFPDRQASRKGICVGWSILEVNEQKQPNDHFRIREAIVNGHKTGKALILFGGIHLIHLYTFFFFLFPDPRSNFPPSTRYLQVA